MAALLCCAAALASGCTSPEQSSLSWRFSFASRATAIRAERVEASISRGSCSSDDVVYVADVARGGDAPAPPKLAKGRYALRGRAFAAGCRTIAYGCVQVLLPSKDGSEYEVVLDDVPEMQVCDGICADACVDGGSAASDAGGSAGDGSSAAMDASPDATSPAPDAAATTDAAADGAVSVVPCSDGKSAPNGHCYRFVTAQKLAWQDAEDDCVSWGGHLVSFNDAAEELWVTNESKTQGFDAPIRFWTGFSDAQVETIWKWSDGSADAQGGSVIYYDPAALNDASKDATRFRVTLDDVYTHWGPNAPTTGNSEPNNGNGSAPTANPGEDCAESRADRISGPGVATPRPEWDDASCTNSKQYVCERSQ